MLKSIKHSKFKNTGILYQVLIRKMIEQASNNENIKSYPIIKQFFGNYKELSKQLYLYSLIMQSKGINDQKKAKYLLNKILQMRMKLDDIKLEKQRYFCIKQIKSRYNLKQLFSTYIQNYKLLANIYKLFESLKLKLYDPLKIVQAESVIIQSLLQERDSQRESLLQSFKKQNSLMKQQILQLLIQKYSKEYEDLDDKQKTLLSKYIVSLSDYSQLQQYINKEISVVKQQLKTSQLFDEQQDKLMLNEMIDNIDNIKKTKDFKTKVYILMNIYQLLKK